MPTVPTYDGGQVREAALPGARLNTNAPAEAFGGGQSADAVNKATQGLVSAGADIFAEQKKIADTVRVEDGKSQAILQSQKLMYGDVKDPNSDERGFITKKGKDAFGVPDEYIPKFDKAINDIENGLSNDSQKAAFRLWAQDRKTLFNDQVTKHVAVEGEEYHQKTTEAGIAVSQDDAVKNYTDPIVVSEAIARQKSLVADYAKAKGFSPDQTKELQLKNLSQTHSLIVEQMLNNGQDQLAGTYLKNQKDEFTGKDYTTTSKAVEVGSVRAESQSASDKIYAAHGDDYAGALNAAKEIKDPKVRDATVERVKADYQQKEQAETYQKKELYQSSYNKLTAAGGDMTKISPVMLSKLDPSQQDELRRVGKQLRSGEDAVTDQALWYGLMQKAQNPETRNDFIKTDLLQYKSKLSDSDFQGLVKLQSKDSTSEEKIKELESNNTIMNDALKTIGVNPSPKKGSPDAQKVYDFHRKATDEYNKLKSSGKKPTNEDMQKIVDGLITKVQVPARFIGTDNKPFYEVKPGDKFQITDINGVPPADRAAIKAKLKQFNFPVTNDEILRRYNIKLQNKVNGQ